MRTVRDTCILQNDPMNNDIKSVGNRSHFALGHFMQNANIGIAKGKRDIIMDNS